MTEPSFLESRGLKPAATSTHSGPAAAGRLVKAYGCFVHPLKLGSKAPASNKGFHDAKQSAAEITGNYGVWTGGSKIVAVDLDDYVPNNECDAFVDTFNLPPTFTVRTGSGGRSLWYRAPEDVELTQRLGFAAGVDIKAGGSYVLGPGNRLAPEAIKEGATGDGSYSFVKDSPKEFAPLPKALIEALLEKQVVDLGEEIAHAAYDAMPAEQKKRIDAYVDAAVERTLADLSLLSNLDDGERNKDGYGWETGTWYYAGAIAQLVKADWTNLTMEDVRQPFRDAIPSSFGEWHEHAVGMLPRTILNDDFPARLFPSELEEIELGRNARVVDFSEAGGSEEPPSAEDITVEANADDWPREPRNEEGHVERTKRWAAGALRWLADEQIWVRYNGVHWERDSQAGAKAARSAMKIARWTEAANYDDTQQTDEKTGKPKPSELDKFVKAMSDQSTDRMFNSVARVLGREDGIETFSTEFDTDDYLLGVANGTVDLRTGELVAGTPEQMISKASPIGYDPAATAPRFQQYLKESIPSEDVRLYLQRVIGYSITGSTLEQVMFIHYGEATNNGKSVLINVLSRMLAEYSGIADPKALIESRNDQHTTHIAGLAGPRLLAMSETARGARLSDVLVKNITGGDEVKARKMREDGQAYRIIGKIHMATNHLPHIVSSASTNRRIHVIPWTVEIPNDKIDLRLAEKLIPELPGILTWAIDGAQLWWKAMEESTGRVDGERPSGLGMPVEVRQATDAYLGDEDEIARWLEERTTAGDNLFETATNLFTDYKWWAERQNTRAMTQTAFSLDLKKRGIPTIRKKTARGFALNLLPMQERSYFNQ